MRRRFAPRRRWAAAGAAPAGLAAALAAGCAHGPPVGEVAWVGVDSVLSARDLGGHTGHSVRLNLEPQRLAAAGVDEAAVAAGRLLLVSCSPSIDATWSSFAIAPPGVALQKGQVVRLRVREDSHNDRLGLNHASGEVAPGLRARQLAYHMVPDWRERGLWRNHERIELPPDQRGRYRIVQGSYVVAC